MAEIIRGKKMKIVQFFNDGDRKGNEGRTEGEGSILFQIDGLKL